MRILLPFLLAISFTSCITSSVVKKAKTDRKPQEVHEIREAYEDTSGNIIVNFTAKLSGAKRNVPVHMVIPVQTLMRIFLGYNSVEGKCSPGEQLLYGVNRIKPVFYKTADSLGYTPEIEHMQERVVEGFYHPIPSDRLVTDRFRLPVNPADYKYETGWTYKRQQRMLMLYQPAVPFQAPNVSIRNILISVEPSHEKKYARYLLTPLTVPADVATSPLQGIGIGFIALLAWAMRY